MEELRQIHVIRATKDLAQDNKIRVAAYCRVSSDSDDQVNSFMAQVRYYTDFINNNSDMRLVDVYRRLFPKDKRPSGKKGYACCAH